MENYCYEHYSDKYVPIARVVDDQFKEVNKIVADVLERAGILVWWWPHYNPEIREFQNLHSMFGKWIGGQLLSQRNFSSFFLFPSTGFFYEPLSSFLVSLASSTFLLSLSGFVCISFIFSSFHLRIDIIFLWFSPVSISGLTWYFRLFLAISSLFCDMCLYFLIHFYFSLCEVECIIILENYSCISFVNTG